MSNSKPEIKPSVENIRNIVLKLLKDCLFNVIPNIERIPKSLIRLEEDLKKRMIV